jgi:hypothetical protein
MLPHATLYDDALQKFCASVREERIKEGDEDGEAQLQYFLTSKATMQQVRDSAADLQQETGRKFSSKKIGDKEIISQKWIDNIMGNIGNAIVLFARHRRAWPWYGSASNWASMPYRAITSYTVFSAPD